MDKHSEESLDVLKGLQRNVLELKENNMDFKDIGKELGITKTQAQELYYLGKRRKEQFELYSKEDFRNISFTDGELKVMFELLMEERIRCLSKLKKKYKHIREFGVQDYHYDMLVKLINKIENVLDLNTTQKIIDAIDKSSK